MCGIAGVVRWNGGPVTSDEVLHLARGLKHRGPDDEGVHVDVEGGCGLAQERLAILDLDPRSRCPLPNEDGTAWVTLNGEIYNYRELRAELIGRGHRFRSEGDAEVIVHLWEESGPRCVERLRGMFAFAVWDARSRELFLARDRVGKKPLAWARLADRFVFASEIAPIAAQSDVSREVDLGAIDDYLSCQYVPAPRTAFRDIRKLPAGCRATLRGGELTVERWWEPRYEPKLELGPDEAAAELRRRVEEATRLRLISDVPLGAFLSGGLDSSVVVASMAAQSSRPVKTYSIGFEEADHDELAWARLVARRFGCDHHDAVLRPDALALLPRIVRHHGEPFADPSAIPSFMVSEFARREVTVALNGDGGDELLAGYERYRADRLARLVRLVPGPILRGVVQPLFRALPHREDRRSTLRRLRRLVLSVEGGARDPASLARQHGQWMQAFGTEDRARLWSDAARERLAAEPRADVLAGLFASARAEDPLDVLLSVDLRGYLADDLLVKMDVASMAASLEARSPLLDHELVEWAARLPVRYKLRGMTSKWLLRRAWKDVLPAEILARGKMGFGVPLERWMRRDLAPFVRALLLEGPARTRGLLRTDEVARLVEEHASGRADHATRLWTLVMLEAWLRLEVEGSGLP